MMTTPRWLKPFERITAGRDVLRSVDGLRFIAISAVILNHIDLGMYRFHSGVTGKPNVWHSLCGQGGKGVALFFGISSFILLGPIFEWRLGGGKPISLKAYFWRRLTRMEPPLILNVLLFWVVVSHHLKQSMAELLPHAAATATYLHNFLFGGASNINPVTWSLEVEAQFYLAVPLLGYLLCRVGKWGRRAGLLLLAAAGVAIHANQWLPFYTLPNHLQYFAAGILVAELWVTGWSQRPPRRVFDAGFAAGLVTWVAVGIAAPPWSRAASVPSPCWRSSWVRSGGPVPAGFFRCPSSPSPAECATVSTSGTGSGKRRGTGRRDWEGGSATRAISRSNASGSSRASGSCAPPSSGSSKNPSWPATGRNGCANGFGVSPHNRK